MGAKQKRFFCWLQSKLLTWVVGSSSRIESRGYFWLIIKLTPARLVSSKWGTLNWLERKGVGLGGLGRVWGWTISVSIWLIRPFNPLSIFLALLTNLRYHVMERSMLYWLYFLGNVFWVPNCLQWHRSPMFASSLFTMHFLFSSFGQIFLSIVCSFTKGVF